MTMAFDICRLDDRWCEAAFDLATEVFVRHSSLHLAVGATLSSYRAYVAADFCRDVLDGLSLVAIDRLSNTLIGVLLVRDFIKPASVPINDPRYAPIAAVTSQLAAIYWHRRHILAGEVALVDMAAVNPIYAGQGVYRPCEWHWRHMPMIVDIVMWWANCHQLLRSGLCLTNCIIKTVLNWCLLILSMMANGRLPPFLPRPKLFWQKAARHPASDRARSLPFRKSGETNL